MQKDHPAVLERSATAWPANMSELFRLMVATRMPKHRKRHEHDKKGSAKNECLVFICRRDYVACFAFYASLERH
ncbi:MAG: hypothetical protein CAPSK01_003449 [Candidatus Accumulibacter vicinus]|uniref:Uncharacterized protein n=1 Tax=Candidatus Accumulibacter vicinus TaxID=2954382 RepID=A0A084XX92_9PROT|nr:MAG: hypothetical protein CAPSK01_003449 [Candidatus Accumulibacter vicinus]